jgi:hypothetical protein
MIVSGLEIAYREGSDRQGIAEYRWIAKRACGEPVTRLGPVTWTTRQGTSGRWPGYHYSQAWRVVGARVDMGWIGQRPIRAHI